MVSALQVFFPYMSGSRAAIRAGGVILDSPPEDIHVDVEVGMNQPQYVLTEIPAQILSGTQINFAAAEDR